MVDELITQIRTALSTRAITKVELAARAGLHRNTLLGCERDDWNPSANTLRALETYLHDINTSADADGVNNDG